MYAEGPRQEDLRTWDDDQADTGRLDLSDALMEGGPVSLIFGVVGGDIRPLSRLRGVNPRVPPCETTAGVRRGGGEVTHGPSKRFGTHGRRCGASAPTGNVAQGGDQRRGPGVLTGRIDARHLVLLHLVGDPLSGCW
ncbi:hypothetical protein [Streptomyces sp. NPDC008125]|uniref:hypothetical protein n=1 Tax=Streptomyces sp. NPDC008125 TaxID=3364811 RepID=UPI0036E82586